MVFICFKVVMNIGEALALEMRLNKLIKTYSSLYAKNFVVNVLELGQDFDFSFNKESDEGKKKKE